MSFAFASRLLTFDAFQQADDTVAEMERDAEDVRQFMDDKSDLDVITELQSQVSNQNNLRRYSQIMNSLLCVILGDSSLDSKYYGFLVLCVRDNFAFVITRLKYLAGPLYRHLQDHVRTQLFWLVDQMLEKRIPQLDQVVLALMRNVQVGTTSPQNIFACSQTLSLLEKHSSWVQAHHGVVSSAVYLFLRTVLDHVGFPDLAGREVKFCLGYLETKVAAFAAFDFCRPIGRELIRLLWDASSIPPIQAYLARLVNEEIPGVTAEYLLSSPTPKYFVQSVLTLDMEANLRFIMENITWGTNEDIYFTWFRDLYLTSPESDTLVSDLIRFVVVAFHPTNEQLQSKLIPRYAVIGKLLKYVKAKNVSSGIKLAICLDLLCFDASKESIMNIEPCVLLMEKSLEKYSAMTSFVIDFLFAMMSSFNDRLRDFFMENTAAAGRKAVEKGVIKSLNRIYESPHLDKRIKEIYYDMFLASEADKLNSPIAVSMPYFEQQLSSLSASSSKLDLSGFNGAKQSEQPEATTLSDIQAQLLEETGDAQTIQEKPQTITETPEFAENQLWMFGDWLQRYKDGERASLRHIMSIVTKMDDVKYYLLATEIEPTLTAEMSLSLETSIEEMDSVPELFDLYGSSIKDNVAKTRCLAFLNVLCRNMPSGLLSYHLLVYCMRHPELQFEPYASLMEIVEDLPAQLARNLTLFTSKLSEK